MKKVTSYKFFIFFLFSLIISSFSQVYIPENKDAILEDLKERHTNLVKDLKGDYKSKIKKEYKKRNEYIKETLLDSVFVFDERYDAYLKTVLQKIEKGNPQLNFTNYLFLFNRDPSPNASCFGNNVFMINLGLFNFLKNEDELAFIICHEIAHQKLNHVNGGIRKRINKANSKEIRKKIRASKSSIYGRSSAGLSLLKELNYGMFKNSRKNEFEADSLGFEIFKNTVFNLSSSANSLERIKSTDEQGIFKTKINLDSLLSFKEYPFKKYWLDEDETMFDIAERVDDYKWNKDSLSSHPDIADRIKKLESFNVSENKEVTAFNEIKSFTQKEQIKSLLYFGNVDLALFFLLKDIQENKQSTFTIIKLIETFKKIYKLKEHHQLGKKIPQTSPFTKEKNLNFIRKFIHNLEIKETRKIGYYLCLKYDELYNANEEFKILKSYFEKLNN